MSLSYKNFLTWQSLGLWKSGLCFMFYSRLQKRGCAYFDTAPSSYLPICCRFPLWQGYDTNHNVAIIKLIFNFITFIIADYQYDTDKIRPCWVCSFYALNHAQITIAFHDTFAVAFFPKRVTVAYRCSQLKTSFICVQQYHHSMRCRSLWQAF